MSATSSRLRRCCVRLDDDVDRFAAHQVAEVVSEIQQQGGEVGGLTIVAGEIVDEKRDVHRDPRIEPGPGAAIWQISRRLRGERVRHRPPAGIRDQRCHMEHAVRSDRGVMKR